MSGEWDDDGVYWRLSDIADRIRRESRLPLHNAFAAHLENVSVALKALVWEFSGDVATGDADDAIRSVIHRTAEIAAATDAAQVALHQLRKALEATPVPPTQEQAP